MLATVARRRRGRERMSELASSATVADRRDAMDAEVEPPMRQCVGRPSNGLAHARWPCDTFEHVGSGPPTDGDPWGRPTSCSCSARNTGGRDESANKFLQRTWSRWSSEICSPNAAPIHATGHRGFSEHTSEALLLRLGDERVAGRGIIAFLSANHIDPDNQARQATISPTESKRSPDAT